jgi:hypothetical protein
VGEGLAGEGAAAASVGNSRVRACAVAQTDKAVAGAGEGAAAICAVSTVAKRADDAVIGTAGGSASCLAAVQLGAKHNEGGQQARAAA